MIIDSNMAPSFGKYVITHILNLEFVLPKVVTLLQEIEPTLLCLYALKDVKTRSNFVQNFSNF